MSFEALPKYIIVEILNYAFPLTSEVSQLQSHGRYLVELSLNKKIQSVTGGRLRDIKDLCLLINKYTCKRGLNNNYHLYDALLTGTQLGGSTPKHSIQQYDKNVEQDIIKIVKLRPDNLNFCEGELRCRTKLTPLYIACINSSVPIPIIAFLIQSKADPNATIKVNNTEKSIIEDLNSHENRGERKQQVIQLLSSDTKAINELADQIDDKEYCPVVPKPITNTTITIRRIQDQREDCFSKTKDKCILN